MSTRKIAKADTNIIRQYYDTTFYILSICECSRQIHFVIRGLGTHKIQDIHTNKCNPTRMPL